MTERGGFPCHFTIEDGTPILHVQIGETVVHFAPDETITATRRVDGEAVTIALDEDWNELWAHVDVL